MENENGIFIGATAADSGREAQYLNLKRANRHGLIAGATGTGKTVTLQGLVDSFSALGVPVFVSDVKGDLAGLAMAGSPTGKMHDIFTARAADIGYEGYAYADNPVVFWDLYGEQGHPIRTTISEMGPLLLARILDLNETQEGVLNIGCCCSIWKICKPCWSGARKMLPRLAPNMAMLPRHRWVRSSGNC